MRVILFALTACAVLIGCGDPEPDHWEINSAKLRQFFQGNHKLLSLTNEKGNVRTSESSGSFFLIVGGYSSTTTDRMEQRASFTWLNHKNQYVFTDIPMNKVRLQINDSIQEPFCKFRWSGGGYSTFDESDWVSRVIYVVLVLKDDQIKREIGIDLRAERNKK